MNGVSSEDFANYNGALLEKIDRQVKLNESIESQLKKIDERLEKAETANSDNQGQTTEEKNLLALENLTKVIQEKSSFSDDSVLKELEKLSSSYDEWKNAETTQQFQNLVTTISKDYEGIKLQTSVINSYGLIFIPALLLIIFLYNLLKEFI